MGLFSWLIHRPEPVIGSAKEGRVWASSAGSPSPATPSSRPHSSPPSASTYITGEQKKQSLNLPFLNLPFSHQIQFSALVPPQTCIVCVEIILICCQFVTTFENFINFCKLLSLFIVLKERTSFVHNCNGIWVKEDVFFNSLTSNERNAFVFRALYCV